MKNSFYIIMLIIFLSCNLEQTDSGLYSVVDNNELAKALSDDQWVGISYGIMGGFVLTLEFDIDKTTMDMGVHSFNNEVTKTTYDIKIENNILSYYDNQTSTWISFFRISMTNSNSDYLSAYFYLNGDESALPVGFHKKERENTLEEYNEYFSNHIWKSENLDHYSVLSFASPYNTKIYGELSSILNEITPQPQLNLYKNTENPARTIEDPTLEDLNKLLEELETTDPLPEFNIEKIYSINLQINFNNSLLVSEVIHNKKTIFSFSETFKIDRNNLYILNNEEWEYFGSINIVDDNSFKLITLSNNFIFKKN